LDLFFLLLRKYLKTKPLLLRDRFRSRAHGRTLKVTRTLGNLVAGERLLGGYALEAINSRTLIGRCAVETCAAPRSPPTVRAAHPVCVDTEKTSTWRLQRSVIESIKLCHAQAILLQKPHP
jgi:hypothetical protein